MYSLAIQARRSDALAFRKAAPSHKPNTLGKSRLLNRSGFSPCSAGAAFLNPPLLYDISQRRIKESERGPRILCPDERLRNVYMREANFGHGRWGQQGKGNLSKSWVESHASHISSDLLVECREHCGNDRTSYGFILAQLSMGYL